MTLLDAESVPDATGPHHQPGDPSHHGARDHPPRIPRQRNHTQPERLVTGAKHHPIPAQGRRHRFMVPGAMFQSQPRKAPRAIGVAQPGPDRLVADRFPGEPHVFHQVGRSGGHPAPAIVAQSQPIFDPGKNGRSPINHG